MDTALSEGPGGYVVFYGSDTVMLGAMSEDYDAQDELLEALGDVRGDELGTLKVYQELGYELINFDGHDVAEDLLQDTQDEFQHAQDTAEWITLVGGRPSDVTEVSDYSRVIPDDPTDVESVVKGVYAMERDAVAGWGRVADLAEEAGYGDIARQASDRQLQERQHLKEFRDIAVGEYGLEEDELEEFHQDF